MIKGLTRKHPKIDVAATMQTLRDSSEEFSSDPFAIDIDCVQGPHIDRSIVKSAVALACDAGLTSADCDLAIAYLRDEEAEYDEDGFWHYYQQDLLANRNIGLPLHCAYVTGNPNNGLLLGYVELYGFVRRVICLSRHYDGESFSRVYAVDPVTGQEINDVQINLDDSTFNSVMTQTAGGLRTGFQGALDQIMASGMLLSRCRTIAKLSLECTREYYERNGMILQSGDLEDLFDAIVNRLKPLLEHYTKPMEFPEGFDPSTGAPS